MNDVKKEKAIYELGQNDQYRSFHCGSGVMNSASRHEDTGLISIPAQWVKDPVLLWAAV